ncbi:MAG: glycosyltransferase [Oculatellaceae cyanobacterium bins.114]|nr:glycosyltransferase [Oculatellaceae cyanobacterium bins.114]
MLPNISILIPCYNAERWIQQAIASALKQTYPNKEVVVIDDGSTDASLEIIKGFGDRIRWETQSNQGGNATRNRLLELSTGEWLQYLDADDYLLTDKLDQQIEILAEHPQTDIIYSPSLLEYHQEGKVWKEILPIPEPHDPWILLARWSLPQTGSPLWRKQAVIDVGGWKRDQPCCQEHELYLRLLMSNQRFRYCEHVGSVYRQWSNLTVCNKNKPETYRHRLDITNRLEQYLKLSGQLTSVRQLAIHQARFECARMIWLFDRDWANLLITQIHQTTPQFLPTGRAASSSYQVCYRLFGFMAAETIANTRRMLQRASINSSISS